MTLSDLSTLSKLAIGLAIAGGVLSFSTISTSSINGVETCDYIDYGKVVFGGLAVMVGGLGEVAALRLAQERMVNLIASGGASLIGVLLVLIGLGILGGPC